MYAVIKTGGKQYRVAANDVIEIEKVSGKVGDWVQFAEVLMVGGETAEVGAPLVKGASVAAEIEDQGRADKVVIFKKRRRHNYRRKKGHRQHLTTVRITEILTGGKAPSQTALPAIWNAELGRIATPRPIVPNGHHSASRKTGRSQAVRFVGAAAKGDHDHDHDHDHEGHDHDHAGHSHDDKKAAAPKATGTDSFRMLTAPEGAADDLGRIGGVADKTAEVLNRNGIFHFWQVAAMTDDEAAKMEKVLKFPGRIRREEWREQAKELMSGKAPRAKVDRDREAGSMGSAGGSHAAFRKLKAPEGGKADELGLIGGVAEKTEKVLNDHGIFHFWQVAAMSEKDVKDLERDLKFPGRIGREEWQEQARELMAGKPPRAKVDRERGNT